MNIEERKLDSPQALARLGGALYLIMIVLGIVGELFIRGKIVVPGNAAATAANLRSMELLWRSGIAIEMVMAYMTNGFVLILAPKLADQVFMLIAGPALLGEASFCLWLLVKGVNVEKWRARLDKIAA